MSKYSLLLRNGRTIQINEATQNQDAVEFVAAARLAAPQYAWLQRSSDGGMLEIRILDAAQDASGSWRYLARLDGEGDVAPAKVDHREWSFLRRK